MKIGAKISPQQQAMLEEARRRGAAAADFLYRISEDEDIRREDEELHPDWAELFDTHRSQIQRQVPPDVFRKMQSFYDEAKPIEAVLREIDPSKHQITFLLGAGASKPDPSHIPTVKELLPQLLERARRLDRDDVTRLADYCDERKIDNIEDLLTAAQIATFCSRTPTVLRLMNYLLYRHDPDEPRDFSYARYGYTDPYVFRSRGRLQEAAADVSSVAFLQDTLQVLFGILASTMLPARPNECHKAIVKYVSASKNAAIVTTNYDCLIDIALEEGDRPLDYRISFANVPAAGNDGAAPDVLIKLHGSLNWYYCETCQEVQRVDISGMIKQFADDAAPYPVIGICKQCGGQRRGLLVPPLAMKFDLAPPLTPLRQNAQKAFGQADLIVVVGYSFAEADSYIARMLSKSMQTKPAQKILVVDPDGRIVSRLRRKFKASIPGFDATRIMRASESCVDFMPKFLGGELLASGHSISEPRGQRKAPQKARVAPDAA